jgi:hypothetical protein
MIADQRFVRPVLRVADGQAWSILDTDVHIDFDAVRFVKHESVDLETFLP